jgi:hypothetical protein
VRDRVRERERAARTLAEVQSNDLSVTYAVVNVEELSVLPGYSHSLGRALLLNTTVDTLVLDGARSSNNYPDTGITSYGWVLVLLYVAKLWAWNNVVLIRWVPSAWTFSKQLLRAVARNTNIPELEMGQSVTYNPSAQAAFLNRRTSVEEVALDISGDVLSDDSRLNLLEVLAHNTQITVLVLQNDWKSDGEILPNASQVLRQPTTLEKLYCSAKATSMCLGLRGHRCSEAVSPSTPCFCVWSFSITKRWSTYWMGSYGSD